MKSSCASRALGALARHVALLLALGVGGSASANTLQEGQACLSATRLPCARAAVDRLRAEGQRDPLLDRLEGEVLFHEGRFAESARVLRDVAARRPDLYQEGTEAAELLRLAEVTAKVHETLVETRIGNVVVVHDGGLDRVLVEEAAQTLLVAQERVGPLLGGNPPIDVRVEFYPDGASFTACTGLPREAVQTTGVVAISKWNRLLMTSPRVLGRGYDWKDTLVHEWIHLVAAWHSDDLATVWLQEGIAKAMDMLWAEPTFSLDVRSQSLLARAVRDQDFVPFGEMHPSFALMDSADRAGLAYAQVSTMIDLVRRSAGPEAVAQVLGRVAKGQDAREAVAAVAGDPTFEAFQLRWRAHIATLPLVQQRIAELPTVLDGQGDSFDVDPVLARRKDLAEKARLGDLMAGRAHHEAALLYYQAAVPEDEPPGPALVERTARSLTALGRQAEALAALEASVRDYPDFFATRRLLGQLQEAAGRPSEALAHYVAANDVYPYDPEVQGRLAALHAAAGGKDRAALHERNLAILTHR